MSEWVWGMRHQVEFESLVASYIDDPLLAGLLESFAVDTSKMPLDEGMSSTDPRSDLRWFPRHGDNRGVDAANNGLSGRTFRYGSGPVMRMVFALGSDGIEGVNIFPGGQSGLIESPYAYDQAALWLGNETRPVPTTPEDVAAAGLWRVGFEPAN
jgi:penicillin amidase